MGTLKRWAGNRKNVRITLNLIRVSLFVLTFTKENLLIKQISVSLNKIIKFIIKVWFEDTLWHKKLNKLGMSISNPILLRKNENIPELLTESVKVLIPANILCQLSLDMKMEGNDLLFKYATELLKNSVNLATENKRFSLCNETARLALQVNFLKNLSVYYHFNVIFFIKILFFNELFNKMVF